jgi:hypothetical protein
MFADRAYSLGLVASPDRLANFLYFAAAVPTVGFVHVAADLSPLDDSSKLVSSSQDGGSPARRLRVISNPRLRADARGRDGSVRQKLAERMSRSGAIIDSLLNQVGYH